MNKLIFGHLNFNFLRNKFDPLSQQVKGSICILMVFIGILTKLNDSFPKGQFLTESFHSPFRFDCNRNGGGTMLCVLENISAKLLSHDFPCAGSFFLEIKLYNKKWLLSCSYNSHKNNIFHLDMITRSLDTHSTKYENTVLLGGFNACVDDETLQTFCKSYSFISLIKQPVCFKNILFSNIIKNLKIPEYQCEDDLRNRLSSQPVLQTILKYRNYPSINNIQNSSKRLSSFYFS